MASIRKKKNGRWEARIRKNGQSICRTFTWKADADIWAQQMERQVEQSPLAVRKEKDRTTLNELLDRYVEVEVPKLKGKEREGDRARFLQTFDIADKYIYRISSRDVAAFRDMRLKKVAASTVRKDLSTLSSVFETAAKEWGYDDLVNPVRMIKRPGGQTKRDVRLTPAERDLLNEIPDAKIRLVAIFCVETSARLLEAMSLERVNVDLGRRTALIHDKVGQKVGRTKRVPLNTRAAAAVKEAIERSDGRYVFSVDDPVEESRKVSEVWRYRKKDWGFRDIVWFKDLRHEAISRFFEKGLSVVEVMSITGHTNPAQLDTYTHLMHQSDLATKLD